MAWLDDHPPARSQFRRPRREDPSGVVVVHTAENAPDTVGVDTGAENVANFIRNRTDPGSYHDLCDSDSCINLVGYDCEAFHDGTGSNPHSYGVSGATQAHRWADMPDAWSDGCVRQMAAASSRYARWLRARSGIVIPAKRITRSQSEARQPGFISHAERDPARRTDPGPDFPWSQFLSLYAEFMGTPTTPKEDEMAIMEFSAPGRPARLWMDGVVHGWSDSADRKAVVAALTKAGYKVAEVEMSAAGYESLSRSAISGSDFD